ncbi:MAG: MFS transporter [Acidimicrobiia bacterium]
MRRRVTVPIPGASPQAISDAAATLDGRPAPGIPASDATLQVEAFSDRITATASTNVHIPWFGWFFHPSLILALRRAARWAATTTAARAANQPDPEPPRTPKLLPPAPFTPAQARALGVLAGLVAIANYGGSLVGQSTKYVAKSFAASETALTTGLAVTRIGVLVTLFAAAIADRRGRRITLLVAVVGICLANLATALAPNLAAFTAAQTFTRGFTSGALTIAAIAAVEEAPEGARAWSFAMMSLAGGAGYAVGVILLPLSDLAGNAWRVAFGVSALSLAVIPFMARDLTETRRYENVTRQVVHRGRIRELFDRRYGKRFAILGGVFFLTAVATTPVAQLTNQFLGDERGFSGLDITLFRTLTNGVPGIIGVVVAGRLAEREGRRPLAVIGIAVSTLLNAAFFLGPSWMLWVASTTAILAAALAGMAIGTLDHELFPTEVRGTSGGFITVCGVLGSVTGLLLTGFLTDVTGSLGGALALLGFAPLCAALFLAPFLPESARLELDEVSPSER